MEKKTFRFEVKIKRCNQIFHPDLGPGVLYIKEIEFSDPRKSGFDSPMFFYQLEEEKTKMITDVIEVTYEERKKNEK